MLPTRLTTPIATTKIEDRRSKIEDAKDPPTVFVVEVADQPEGDRTRRAGQREIFRKKTHDASAVPDRATTVMTWLMTRARS